MPSDNASPIRAMQIETLHHAPVETRKKEAWGYLLQSVGVVIAVSLCAILSALAAQNIDGWMLAGAILMVVVATIAIIGIGAWQRILMEHKKEIAGKISEVRVEDASEVHADSAANANAETNAPAATNMNKHVPDQRQLQYPDQEMDIVEVADIAEMNTESAVELISISQGLRLYSTDTSYRFAIDESDERCQEKRELNKLFEAAENQANTKKALIQNIAHEIKTPLTSLKLVAEGIEDGVFTSDDEYTQKTINENVERIDATVKMMTQYARGCSDAMEEISGDLGSCLCAAYEKARAMARRRREVNVRYDGAYEGTMRHQQQVLVKLSSQSLCSIFDALIENSFDHAKDMHTISLRSDYDTHPDCPSVKMIKVSFQDDGKGMTADMPEKMLEPFWKADESHMLGQDKVASPGLGLPIVKNMIESNGGKIAVRCGIEIGTVIEMWLPIAEQSHVWQEDSQRDIWSISDDGEIVLG